jgi:hypothetical protein
VRHYLIGMAHAGKKFVLLLDLDQALSAEQLYGARAIASAIQAAAAGEGGAAARESAAIDEKDGSLADEL